MPRRNTTLRDKHRRMIARTKAPCALCGSPIDYSLPHMHPDEFVVDHIRPWATSHDDRLSNKQPAHRRCNLVKSDRQELELRVYQAPGDV